MKIIKRDGREVPYDHTKIKGAITAANAEVDDKISDTAIGFIVGNVEKRCSALARPVHVEEVQETILAVMPCKFVRFGLVQFIEDHVLDFFDMDRSCKRLTPLLDSADNEADSRIRYLLRHLIICR